MPGAQAPRGLRTSVVLVASLPGLVERVAVTMRYSLFGYEGNLWSNGCRDCVPAEIVNEGLFRRVHTLTHRDDPRRHCLTLTSLLMLMPHNFPRAWVEKMLSIIGCALAQSMVLKAQCGPDRMVRTAYQMRFVENDQALKGF